MAKCKKCGKMGLFLKLNKEGLCNECASNVVKIASRITNIDKELKMQDKQFAKLTAAEEKYEENGDINNIISVYEEVFIKEKSTLVTQSRWFKLADLYVKNGQNDKAWAWLNQLAILHPDYTAKIEEKRYKILKKENKHLEDAMIHLMASIGYSEGNAGPLAYYNAYGRNKFLKEVPSLIKKLKWEESDIEKLEKILSDSISQKKFDYKKMVSSVKDFVNSKNK